MGDVELQPIDERLGGGAAAGFDIVAGSKNVAGDEEERWTGRIALFAVFGIIIFELLSGQSLVSFVQS